MNISAKKRVKWHVPREDFLKREYTVVLRKEEEKNQNERTNHMDIYFRKRVALQADDDSKRFINSTVETNGVGVLHYIRKTKLL